MHRLRVSCNLRQVDASFWRDPEELEDRKEDEAASQEMYRLDSTPGGP